MEQEIQTCSMESQIYMWSDEEESILEPEEDTDNPQDQEEYLN